MSAGTLGAVMDARLEHAGLAVSTDARTRLVLYLDLLARWNRKLNLTAFNLDAPTDEAVDRLIIEPVMALSWGADASVALDIGSGGGSPAVPLLVVCNNIMMTLVEARERKAAFLREAIRVLQLDAEVAVTRFEDFARTRSSEYQDARTFDFITMRAVKAGEGIWRAVASLMAPTGSMIWFASKAEAHENAGLLQMFGLTQDHEAERFRRIRRI